jgi:transcriptional regulator GlxA family with amidase domain
MSWRTSAGRVIVAAAKKKMATRRIGILGFENAAALDIVGPADVFATASELNRSKQGEAAYEVILVGVSGKAFRSDSGLVFKPNKTLKSAPSLDTLIIPGGHGLRDPATNTKVVLWIRSRANRIPRIASVCTGIYGLAPTGLLDGRKVATHWKFAADVSKKFPRLKVQPDAIFVKDGRFHTAAGVTSGIDLALALVQEDLGPQAALDVARVLVVYMKRPGGQEQYSEPLRFQTQATDRFSELAAWMAGHLGGDLSVEALAARACVCARHFSRRFKREFGVPPASFVEDMRLSEARRLLSSGSASIESVARSVGFGSADSFRRAFERRFRIAPSGYRGRFSVQEVAS